jgi:uncharacterized protein YkwD
MGWLRRLLGLLDRPAPPMPPPPPPAPHVTDADADAREVARLVGLRRGAPLPIDGRLADAARSHARDMARRGYFDHDSPEGVSPEDRARSAGHHGEVREVIARGYNSPAAVVAGWMGSAGHRAALMDPMAVAIGSGVAGPYRVALVGLPPGAASPPMSPPGLTPDD